jgi:hypothetical protein
MVEMVGLHRLAIVDDSLPGSVMAGVGSRKLRGERDRLFSILAELTGLVLCGR